MSVGISLAGVYSAPQKDYTQITESPWLGLHLCGMTLFELPTLGVSLTNPGPFLMLFPKGTKIHFSSRIPRENWIAFASEGLILPGKEKGLVEISVDGLHASSKSIVPLEESDAAAAQLEFANLRDALSSPFESSALMAELTAASLLRMALRLNANVPNKTLAPALALKTILDSPEGLKLSFKAMAGRCGYSADHLRKLFKSQYGILPHEYLERKRMALAMEMLASGDMKVKEISDKLRFKHLSHFSLRFKEHFGMAPREAIRRFRERNMENSASKWR